ncbi:heparan-alpha-glucosaminide N-acetyltransferase domain-containing protein [Citricoccus nitrophenolicus]|uniref:Heparan-alpha-glucosaminide N-acetyltransferase domain-containing protein n=1 Tax=Citricoccus nitrophenolicus TaxID=863575 RepID=A0ABV0IM53_9MICC
MGSDEVMQGAVVDAPAATEKRPRKRLIGIDAARGLALIGLMAIHILPNYDEETGEPTLVWQLFSGDSAALFALLAGVGLALSSGGRTPHRGRQMAADRVGLVVRAVLIAVVALVIASLMPAVDPPAYSILIYYAVFFLLAIPFLHLGPKALFICAAVFGIVSPILLQHLPPVLPDWLSYNPTLEHILADPASVASQLLLTGTYPALPYMTYLLAGLGLGRLNLRSIPVQSAIAGTGAALAILATVVSYILLYAAGGYEALLATGMTEDGLDEAIVYGPELVPDTSGWWLAIATPHTNMPLAIASSLGMGLLAAGLFLLIANQAGRWLIPLASMGAMTLTLYSAHLVALSFELHYDEPVLWFMAHLGVAGAFAWAWNRMVGQGPLEKVVSLAVKGTRRLVTGKTTNTKPPAAHHLDTSVQTPPGTTDEESPGSLDQESTGQEPRSSTDQPTRGTPLRTERGTIMYTEGEDHAGYTGQPARDPDTTTR